MLAEPGNTGEDESARIVANAEISDTSPDDAVVLCGLLIGQRAGVVSLGNPRFMIPRFESHGAQAATSAVFTLMRRVVRQHGVEANF
jgi:hypothetical protein